MKLLLSFCCFFTLLVANAQTVDTLAFQDFEITPEAPVWSFTGPVVYNSGYSSASAAAPTNSPLGINGSRAWETTTNSGGLVLDFANTTIPVGYDSIRVRFNLAAMNLLSTGGGPDNLDYVVVAYSTDGGTAYSNRLRIRGALTDNSYWGYDATGVAQVYYQPATEALFQPTSSGAQTTLGYSTCEIVFPGTVTQLAIRITGRSSSSTDTWMIDNLVMTGENDCIQTLATVNETSCSSYTWAQNGETYTATGLYNDTIPNAAGCDSIITLDLTILNPTSATQTVASCESYDWPENGMTYTSGGLYTATIPNAAGCDSIITLDLTILSPTAATQTAASCESYTWPLNGATYTLSGWYNHTIPNAAGCDSIITLELTIYEESQTTQNEVSCGPYTWPTSGQTIGFSGTYSWTLQNVNGCDSVITLALLVQDPPTAQITHDGNGTLSGDVPGAVVLEWIDCATGLTIPSQQGLTIFTPSQNGDYAVVVYDGTTSCTDTSDCFTVDFVGLNEAVSVTMQVVPNPAAEMVTVTFSDMQAQLIVFDAQGKAILQKTVVNKEQVSMGELQAGVYFFELRTEKGHAVQRVIRE
jgi:hypothetical protein